MGERQGQPWIQHNQKHLEKTALRCSFSAMVSLEQFTIGEQIKTWWMEALTHGTGRDPGRWGLGENEGMIHF